MTPREKDIMWTICGWRSGDKNPIWLQTETFATKREAVTAMMGRHKAKTAIVRAGHMYMFQVAD